MFPTRSDLTIRRGAAALALVFLAASPGRAQEAPRIVSHEVSISRNQAELELELDDGTAHILAVRGGRAFLNGEDVGAAPRGQSLDRSWRELLSSAIELSGEDLNRALIGWDPEDGAAADRLDRALETRLTGQAAAAGQDAAGAAAVGAEGPYAADSVARLLERIEQLEQRLEEDDFGVDRAEIESELRSEIRRDLARERESNRWFNPFRNVWRGLMGILSMLATFAVLGAIGVTTIFFGRRYVEGVADTARHATLRSGLVGLAAIFLSFPAWIIGAIALAISIVGIPLLLVWMPLFPVAVALTVLFGYLAAAHASGEALAERRFEMGDWFKYGNSYYYLLSGLGLLLALFIASNVVQMAGGWLEWLQVLLIVFGVLVTVVATAIGVGAALISRGGTRPLSAETVTAEPTPDLFEEEDAGV